MDLTSYRQPNKSLARNATESLIEDIVAATNEKNTRRLARVLAITARTLKWTESDLHALYQKRLDPKVTNYTGLVWWHVKIHKKV